jgi:hypothetical protein
MRSRLWWAALAVCSVGCFSEHSPPGKQVIGTYAFQATQTDAGGCFGPDGGPFLEQPQDGGFGFEATLSYNPGDGAFMTVGDVDRDAGFDGARFTSWASSKRLFSECSCGENMVVNERISLAILSASQRNAVNGNCPPDALDGGVPVPGDGGIVGPGPISGGFDAPLACGEQVDEVAPVPDAGCKCAACRFVYRVQGVKK